MTNTTAEDPDHIARRYLVEDDTAHGVPLLDSSRPSRSGRCTAEYLDIGTMEAVVPILLARKGPQP